MPDVAPFSLTAIGTIRGRVSRPELCLSAVESELSAVARRCGVGPDNPVRSVSVVIHLGAEDVPPHVWGLRKVSRELEVAVGVRFADVRRKDRDVVCQVMRAAAWQALVAACHHVGLAAPTDLDAENRVVE